MSETAALADPTTGEVQLLDYGLAWVCARCHVPVTGAVSTVAEPGAPGEKVHEPCGCRFTVWGAAAPPSIIGRSVTPTPRPRPAAADTSQQQYLTTQEVAELLRTSPETVRYWRHIGAGPSSFKLGRRVLYAAEDVRAFIAQARAGGAV
jgi:excisionase family DNA binding protein